MMIVHVVTATDDNGLVRDQEVWGDQKAALERFDHWKGVYGGEFVCIASRRVLAPESAASKQPAVQP